ncbi:recombinase family protein, partial [[Clostridium] innocuum]|nr:recombinase family protein [[Clostridium] innocuum]
MCAYSVFNTFPVYPLSAKPLILLAFCRYRYHTSLFERPDFQRMMDDMEAGKVNCIVTKDLSRFGREHVMMDYYLEFLFPEKRVRYIAVAEKEDTEKGLSDFVPFKNLFNEWFAKDTSRKLKAAFKAK